MKKKYFYIQYVKGGKTYFKDQDGKRTSRDKAERSKKKIVIEAQRSEGETVKKGDLIDRRKAKQKEVKDDSGGPGERITGTELSIKNIYVSKELQNAIEKNYRVFTKAGGKLYEHKSKESKAKALLFNNAMQERFYNKLKKKLDSPFFNLKAVSSKKNKTIFIDFDSVELDKEVKGKRGIKTAVNSFNQDLKTLTDKFYKGKK
jgi:hypothetical protein